MDAENLIQPVVAPTTDFLADSEGKLTNTALVKQIVDSVHLEMRHTPKPVSECAGTSSVLDPGPALNLYSTAPRGNRLQVEEEDEEPLYSTVRHIKVVVII